MNRLDVTLNDAVTTVALDDPVGVANRNWGVVALRVVDELTGEPPRGSISLTCSNPALTTRVAEDGLVGLAAVPAKVFPGLKTVSYSAGLTIQAAGYLGMSLTATLPINPAFPASFDPLILPDLPLHRLPIVFRGRTMRLVAGNLQVAPAASVRVSGVWRSLPPANVVIPAEAPNLIALSQPLYANRANAISSLARRDLAAVAGDDKQMMDSLPAGTTTLRLSNRHGLTIGDVLLVEGNRPDREEFLSILAINGGSTPDQIAQISLQFPTALSHRQGSLVQQAVNSGPLGAANTFTQDGIPGDTTVFLNGLVGLTPANQVRISGGAADEFHGFQIYAGQSDPNGYYRLPPLSRVAQVELQATDGIHTVKTIVSPNYEQPENLVDFVFS
ncbi:MAG TPA: hypothetical protein VMC09_11460 [Anaerolineales bacterium]|nr:hypothetical protein [Anaerolineales bacterium]